jgi:RNA-binding protein
MKLESKQRARLKALAHPLKPVLHIGKDGVTGAVLRNIEEAFNTRELIKVKVLDTAPESARQTGVLLEEKFPSLALVHVIGRTLILYKEPDGDGPEDHEDNQ